MVRLVNEELLKNKEVIQEIERFKWIESEKAGRDIGFDNAARDWLAKFSDVWIKTHQKGIKGLNLRAKMFF